VTAEEAGLADGIPIAAAIAYLIDKAPSAFTTGERIQRLRKPSGLSSLHERRLREFLEQQGKQGLALGRAIKFVVNSAAKRDRLLASHPDLFKNADALTLVGADTPLCRTEIVPQEDVVKHGELGRSLVAVTDMGTESSVHDLRHRGDNLGYIGSACLVVTSVLTAGFTVYGFVHWCGEGAAQYAGGVLLGGIAGGASFMFRFRESSHSVGNLLDKFRQASACGYLRLSLSTASSLLGAIGYGTFIRLYGQKFAELCGGSNEVQTLIGDMGFCAAIPMMTLSCVDAFDDFYKSPRQFFRNLFQHLGPCTSILMVLLILTAMVDGFLCAWGISKLGVRLPGIGEAPAEFALLCAVFDALAMVFYYPVSNGKQGKRLEAGMYGRARLSDDGGSSVSATASPPPGDESDAAFTA
jgi:hypothetical protein